MKYASRNYNQTNYAQYTNSICHPSKQYFKKGFYKNKKWGKLVWLFLGGDSHRLKIKDQMV